MLATLTSKAQTKDTTLFLYFNTDSYTLDTLQINQVRQFLEAVTGISKVIGYADSVGTTSYNQHLSKKRALYTAQIIKELPEKLIYFKGEEIMQSRDLSKERRVEIVGYIKDSILAVFDIENIFFVPDKPVITPESFPYIRQLVQRLRSYQNAYFELVGHVNYQSKHDSSFLKDLFTLSENRAKVIFDLLVENGISANLISYKGVGNTQPIYPDPSNDDERRKNMRVEVIVYRYH